jgi:hypothetical protein
MSRLVAALVLAMTWPALASAQLYRHPSTCQDGCMTVSAYRDHGGRTDWNCGGITYGGHGGTDFATYGGWGAVDEGREVVAAAEGTVVQANDGEFDRCTTGDCSGGGGFGNYVAIQHPDGVVTYYGHQRTGSIAVSVGDWVTCGQHLGFIASSGSSTGPHLHFEPRAPGGFDPFGFGGCSDPSTRWIDQGPYAALPGVSCPVTDRVPEGWIDVAACEGIRGWARDPDDGGPIDVHVYLDGAAGDPAATGYPIHANVHRDDVGDHGYSFTVPYGFMDGRDHVVFAYGIGAGGGANALLSGAPAILHCDPPAAPFPDGVRRHVVSGESFGAWHFDGHDIVHVDDATLSAWPDSSDWPLAPELIGADGDPGVYLRDVQLGEATRRHVPSPEAMDRWRLDWGAIASIDLASLTALDFTSAISTRPYLVQGSGPVVYVIDAPPPTPVAAPSDAGSMIGDDAGVSMGDGSVHVGDAAGRDAGHAELPSGRDGRALSGGCAVGGGSGGSWTIALLLCVAVRRRRTRA